MRISLKKIETDIDYAKRLPLDFDAEVLAVGLDFWCVFNRI